MLDGRRLREKVESVSATPKRFHKKVKADVTTIVPLVPRTLECYRIFWRAKLIVPSSIKCKLVLSTLKE